MEYLHGGLEISLIIAVDFTASNGSPQSPTSLHYYDLSNYIYIYYIYLIYNIYIYNIYRPKSIPTSYACSRICPRTL